MEQQSKKAKPSRRYELLPFPTNTPPFKLLGKPGSQAGVFVGRSIADPDKQVALKVFFTSEMTSAPKEAVLLSLERPLRMRRMPRPKLTTLPAPGRRRSSRRTPAAATRTSSGWCRQTH